MNPTTEKYNIYVIYHEDKGYISSYASCRRIVRGAYIVSHICYTKNKNNAHVFYDTDVKDFVMKSRHFSQEKANKFKVLIKDMVVRETYDPYIEDGALYDKHVLEFLK